MGSKWARPVAVFFDIGGNLQGGLMVIVCIDIDGDLAIGPGVDEMGDASGRKDQRTAVELLPITKAQEQLWRGQWGRGTAHKIGKLTGRVR